jgi:hypothetical protein
MPDDKIKVNCWIDSVIFRGESNCSLANIPIINAISLVDGINVISLINNKDSPNLKDDKSRRVLAYDYDNNFFIINGEKYTFDEAPEEKKGTDSKLHFILRVIKAVSNPHGNNKAHNYFVTDNEEAIRLGNERGMSAARTNLKVLKVNDYFKEIRKYLYHGESTNAYAFSEESTTEMGLTRWESFLFAPSFFSPNLQHFYCKNTNDYIDTLREKIMHLLRTRANIDKYTGDEYINQGNALLDNIKYYFDYWCSLVVSTFDVLGKVVGNKINIDKFDLRYADKIESLSNRALKDKLQNDRAFICLFYAIRNLIVHDTGHGSVHQHPGKPWGYVYANEKYLNDTNKNYINDYFDKYKDTSKDSGIKRSRWCLGENTDCLEIDPVVFVQCMTPVIGEYINNILLLVSGETKGIDKYEYFLGECRKDNNHWFYLSLAFLESL